MMKNQWDRCQVSFDVEPWKNPVGFINYFHNRIRLGGAFGFVHFVLFNEFEFQYTNLNYMIANK